MGEEYREVYLSCSRIASFRFENSKGGACINQQLKNTLEFRLESSLSIPCLKYINGTKSEFLTATISKALVFFTKDRLLKVTHFEVRAGKFTQEAKHHNRVFSLCDTIHYSFDTISSSDAKNEFRSPKLREIFLLLRNRLIALLNFVSRIHHHIPFPTTYLPLGGKNSNPCYEKLYKVCLYRRIRLAPLIK